MKKNTKQEENKLTIENLRYYDSKIKIFISENNKQLVNELMKAINKQQEMKKVKSENKRIIELENKIKILEQKLEEKNTH